MNRKVLENLRDMIAPMQHPVPERAADFNAALLTFKELVDAVIEAEEAGVRTRSDLDIVLGMYRDLLVERAGLMRDDGGTTSS